MLNLIGSTDDNFAIFASPAGRGMYHVVVYPEVTELEREIAISWAKLRSFMDSHRSSAEAAGVGSRADVFIHSLSEEEVLELTSGARLARLRQNAA